MNATVKIQQRGTVTLPKKIRDMFELEEGSFLSVSQKGNSIVLKPQRNPKLHDEVMTSLAKGLADLESGNGISFSSIRELHHKLNITD